MSIIDANENVLRVLVSTDNHVGYAEKDGLRGQDTFRTFEEILRLAVSHNVDFILFAGDIFHESRPSMRSLHEVMRLLRIYCLGSKPVHFELLSEAKNIFSNTAFHTANYLDGNLNVGIPVFTIHGNHDDPSGPGGLCAADLLHTAGLVNLFGKFSSVERIDLTPVLLRKGNTRVALYGLGSVREERLHRLFLNNSVTFYRPTECADDWFSICTVHQNRVQHGPTSYLPENFLPDFLDLVIWGHEHECRVEPEWNSSKNFYVVQPGSSVATALSEGESQNKAVALLEIREKEFKVTRLPLRTVRPFLFKDLVLQDYVPKLDPNSFDIVKQIESICAKIIESEISNAVAFSSEALANELNPDTSKLTNAVQCESNENVKITSTQRLLPPVEPLIRLRVDVSGGFESFSGLRFGQKFVGRVANPKDLIVFNRNREKLAAAQANRALKSGLQNSTISSDPDEMGVESKKVGLNSSQVEELVRHYLLQMVESKGQKTSEELTFGLSLFTTRELERGLRRYVDRGISDAINHTSSTILNKTIRHLRMRKAPEERIVPDILSYCCTRSCNSTQNEDSDKEENGDDYSPIKPSNHPKNETRTTKPAEPQEIEWSLEEDETEQMPVHNNLSPEKVQVNKMYGKTLQKKQPIKKKPVPKCQLILQTNDGLGFDSDNDEATTLADMVEDASTDDDANSSLHEVKLNEQKSIGKNPINLPSEALLKTNRRGRGAGGDVATSGLSRSRGTNPRVGSKSGSQLKNNNDDRLDFDFRRKRRKID
ncbi:Double-strand break repair protein MRE11 [Schistosoma japonicum]|nr:Double-strand break repair protein MRE11 [Schistosoma japonicum]